MSRLEEIMNEAGCLVDGEEDSFWVRSDEVRKIPYIKVVYSGKRSWLIRLMDSEDRWFSKHRCILMEEDNLLLAPHWMDGVVFNGKNAMV